MPGGGSYSVSPPKSTPPPKQETTCSSEYKTKTSTGEKQTTYLSTKTVIIPITTVSGKPTTSVSPCPFTSTGVKTTASPLDPALIPVTSYSTKTKSEVKTKTKVETSKVTSVGTTYKTSVGTVPYTYVTSKEDKTVITETKKVPYTETKVETKTVCTTKGGYGGGY
ncbi:hypothetical protein N0V94_000004 [Neodidymelliopsis sp. IMI 364377]|nr:hypothetical protein N0V94_000004 [Neodidymelliopsis sp. IMI 364377]